MIIIKGFGENDLLITQGFGITTLDRYKDQEPITVSANVPGIPKLIGFANSDKVYIVQVTNVKVPAVVAAWMEGTALLSDRVEQLEVSLSELLSSSITGLACVRKTLLRPSALKSASNSIDNTGELSPVIVGGRST